MNQSPALYQAIEGLLNRQFEDNPPARKALAHLVGETLAVELNGTGVNVFLTARDEGISLGNDFDEEPGAIISGSPLALLAMVRSQREAAATASRSGVKVHGDPGVAQGFARLLGHLKPDWEEELSRLIGDAAAHRMGRAFRDLWSFGQSAGSRMGEGMATWLTAEGGELPTAEEAERFFDEVDTLRDDVERASVRLESSLARHRRPNA